MSGKDGKISALVLNAGKRSGTPYFNSTARIDVQDLR
jgi:hypothetical protein